MLNKLMFRELAMTWKSGDTPLTQRKYTGHFGDPMLFISIHRKKIQCPFFFLHISQMINSKITGDIIKFVTFFFLYLRDGVNTEKREEGKKRRREGRR